MPGRVLVVGLGPAGGDHVLPAARAALSRAPRRFVRTARHPAVDDLTAEGIAFESFDDRYDDAASLDDVYPVIVAALIDAAGAAGEVAYAVPGNPVVAERTVALLREAATRGEIDLEVIPGLSFAELAWTRLAIDPMVTEARVVDGRAFDDVDVAGPLLIAQCDTPFVLADVKLRLLEHLEPDAPVVVLQRLGLPDEQVRALPLVELDRSVEPDHLTSVFVRAPAGPAQDLVQLLQLSKRLRNPGGCPWDAEQTHRSLSRYLLEEAYEVVEALEQIPADAPGGAAAVPAGRYAALADELGDLLYQVVFHAVLAEEEGAFDLGDVARGIHDKLVRRHPHVFGDVDVEGTADVMRNWEQIKREEKSASSIVAGITPGLPSLLYAHKLYRKAASVGLEPGTADDALARIEDGVAALRDASADHDALVGEVLAAAVVLARASGVDAESALRGWAARFRTRFEAVEVLASERGIDLASIGPEAVAALWAETAG